MSVVEVAGVEYCLVGYLCSMVVVSVVVAEASCFDWAVGKRLHFEQDPAGGAHPAHCRQKLLFRWGYCHMPDRTAVLAVGLGFGDETRKHLEDERFAQKSSAVVEVEFQTEVLLLVFVEIAQISVPGVILKSFLLMSFHTLLLKTVLSRDYSIGLFSETFS